MDSGSIDACYFSRVLHGGVGHQSKLVYIQYFKINPSTTVIQSATGGRWVVTPSDPDYAAQLQDTVVLISCFLAFLRLLYVDV